MKGVGMPGTGYLFLEEGLRHDTGPTHPERPARLTAVRDAFAAASLTPATIETRKAAREDLMRVHLPEHIDTIAQTCAANARYPDPDTTMMEDSWDAALLAAGSAIAACQAVLEGEFENAFCAMRPPGHHAEHDRAMGFCLFNNVAVAAKWLRDVAGLKRVAILDWDVHHGNGTQHSFYDDPSIYYISLHQYPHYPGTGRAEERGAEGTNLNLPMAPGTPAEAWVEAVEEVVVPELEGYAPDFLLLSCGFDAHERDPLSHQHLRESDYARMTRAVKGVAGGKVVSLLEGGYDLESLGLSAVAHFKALSGE